MHKLTTCKITVRAAGVDLRLSHDSRGLHLQQNCSRQGEMIYDCRGLLLILKLQSSETQQGNIRPRRIIVLLCA